MRPLPIEQVGRGYFIACADFRVREARNRTCSIFLRRDDHEQRISQNL